MKILKLLIEIAPGRALGAPQMRKIVPRGSRTGPREGLEVPITPQRANKATQEDPKVALGGLKLAYRGSFGAKMNGF